MPIYHRLFLAVPVVVLMGVGQVQAQDAISADSFGCVRDMTPVEHFYVDNLLGDVDATVAVAQSADGGTYPEGSVVQLVPAEVMVKRETGFNPVTNDWEFFELDVSDQGTAIRVRGFAEVNNRFGGNCFACHVKAEPKWDLICGSDHGCDPIPITRDMISALQKTDPRCEPVALTDAEKSGLKSLQALSP
ncbi:conserved hypothetical protein [Luminiphilus syltensis NOR5-1B]|uniref:Cytochrome P460 domain-containing protein n=1 Tax=Luminiphilus syltensis NOR5-1B TaxID=565045 RepID=B8KWN9_9GAMM|nr:hypothetical protein [Luminiphilus syltensis]EED35543.1 conserved hypothetical protein [Luminiphilus syltensis NOR5-1B]